MPIIKRSKINNSDYMRFPFRITNQGSALSNKAQHVRQQIEQILFTNPHERWYRPEFGIGVKTLVFEPNNSALRDLVKQRLLTTLAESLKADVLPASLKVDVQGENEKLKIFISYEIAALQQVEKLAFTLGGES
ncbi:MAG TPA: phage baseplate protein [Oceanospirillales bacterium]|nr:phage baseplate protein [Oceanospirillales bacterium]